MEALEGGILNPESAISPKMEIKSLTGLRGICALYVVLFHYLSFHNMPSKNPALVFLAHGYLAVDLFFILSGFVMTMTYGRHFRNGHVWGSYLNFLRRRFARIYPLYFVTTLACFGFVLAGWIAAPGSGTLLQTLVSNIMMIQVWGIAQSFDPAAWSISAEWAAYLVFPALLIATRSTQVRAILAVGLLCSVALAILCVLPADHGRLLNVADPFLGLPLLRCLPEFVLGILAYEVYRNRIGFRIGSSELFSSSLCVTVLLLLAIRGSDLFVVLLFPPLIIVMAWGSQRAEKLLSGPMPVFLGTISYSVYLTHALLYGILIWVHTYARALGASHAQSYAAIIGFVLTIPTAFAAYKCIELPGRRWLQPVSQSVPSRRVSSDTA